MAGKQSYSGSRSSSARAPTGQLGARRNIRLGPPANDNIHLGGLRFTGLRIAMALTVGLALMMLLRATNVF
ncbi:MAG: hypothetical protein ABI439_07380 [Rhodospirillales bacterium]